MASLLQLPRELYLMICSYLSAKGIAGLAGVSRDHYLAAQQPLFHCVSLSSYRALVKLVGTLLKVPIVSDISAKQRQRWHKLSDEQLRERDIKYLNLLLDCRHDGARITGATFAQCVGAISRKCVDVQITLTLNGVWRNFATQLETAEILNIRKLTMFVGEKHHSDRANINLLRMKIWQLVFSGLTFPDLQDVTMNTLVESEEDMPVNMEDGLALVTERFDRFSKHGATAPVTQAYGLFHMKEIKLEYNTFLTGSVLRSLFDSTITLQRLTKLEIVNCPRLHPIRDLQALASLFKKTLQLLQFLKVHLAHEYCMDTERYAARYTSKINANPAHHLCNIVRELGQDIKGLDIALPFACSRVFIPPSTGRVKVPQESLQLPSIPEEPVNTLPQRLMDAGYRYRRLICYEICREAHKWDEMAALASSQDGNISWEILSGTCDQAWWCVGGCLPIEFSVGGAMRYPFNKA